MQQIEKAFHFIRWVAVTTILGMGLLSATTVYCCLRMVRESQRMAYVLSDGQVFVALGSLRGDNILAEARDQIITFHEAFYTLSPDHKLIDEHLNKAFNLSDGSAHDEYQKLLEKDFYSNIVSNNVTQEVHTDSVWIDTASYPYHFKYFGTLTITRSSSITTRKCWTEGYLRAVPRSENNAHGLLIEKWNVYNNTDISTVPRNINP
jgi:conjugative transposon TraK protein